MNGNLEEEKKKVKKNGRDRWGKTRTVGAWAYSLRRCHLPWDTHVSTTRK